MALPEKQSLDYNSLYLLLALRSLAPTSLTIHYTTFRLVPRELRCVLPVVVGLFGKIHLPAAYTFLHSKVSIERVRDCLICQ